jgi:hypothetical protein
MSFLPPVATVAVGLLTVIVGMVLYSARTPSEAEPIAQRPSFPGVNSIPGAVADNTTIVYEGDALPPGNEGAQASSSDDSAVPAPQPTLPVAPTPRPPFSPPTNHGPIATPGSSTAPSTIGTPSVPRNNNTQAGNHILTDTVGGTGGFPFEKVDPQGRPVIGVEFRLGSWAGKERVGQLTPLFDRTRTTRPNTIVAREGYALGAIHVTTSEFVDGITLEFMRLNDEVSLLVSDSYKADPIGEMAGTTKVITSDGKLVIGLHGRGGAVMDSIGLVIRQ